MMRYKAQENSLGLFYEHEGGETLYILSQRSFSDYDSLWIFIGSEGGFPKKEFKALLQEGLKSVTLGSQILKVETACISAISIIKYFLERG